MRPLKPMSLDDLKTLLSWIDSKKSGIVFHPAKYLQIYFNTVCNEIYKIKIRPWGTSNFYEYYYTDNDTDEFKELFKDTNPPETLLEYIKYILDKQLQSRSKNKGK